MTDPALTLPALDDPTQPVIRDLTCAVTSHRQCGNGLFVLSLRPDQPVALKPGHFVMVAMPSDRFLFRRPFSIMRQDSETGVFDIFYRQVGLGTTLMLDWMIGDTVKVLGPLGNTFPAIDRPTLVIGGGIGIAPVYFAGLGNPLATCVYGARSEADLGLLPELKEAYESGDRLHIATDDGSMGFHGHVGQLLAALPEVTANAKAAYICGPTPMMRAISQQLLAAQPDMAVYVSMEEHMPCGIGACTGCVVARTGNRLPVKTCVDGPVLLATDVDWEGSCWAHPAPNASVVDSVTGCTP